VITYGARSLGFQVVKLNPLQWTMCIVDAAAKDLSQSATRIYWRLCLEGHFISTLCMWSVGRSMWFGAKLFLSAQVRCSKLVPAKGGTRKQASIISPTSWTLADSTLDIGGTLIHVSSWFSQNIPWGRIMAGRFVRSSKYRVSRKPALTRIFSR
jgi:hypothetical protein